ncbi:MAG: glycosyltransferase [Desulfitobacteriaceae bacterium]|nr:glycosyltransferase [Desulfitobacteriaceae bacterium]MDI6878264.1 glycosyltransferase [Desulfitobacteriaceae bacterium]MDI6913818.1 glycosyltransferase [Desulfitobacteriaceae bacterium]
MARLCLLANAASSHTEKWASELVRRGWEVDIISFLPASIPHVVIHVVPPIFGSKTDVILRQHWIVRKVKQLKPDLVHAHYASSFGFLGALADQHPLIISAWGSDIFAFPRKSILHRRLLKWTLKQADVLCSTSRIMAETMASYLESGRRIEVIPFGVDVTRFAPPSEKGDGAVRVVFGVAKYLQPVYGLDVLLKAFAELDGRLPGRVLLRIAGEGPESKRLGRLAKRLGIEDKVEWPGFIPNREVARFYQELDVVVVPSYQESFGVTAVEGSACARPIIASRVGGLPEVVLDGKTGLLVTPGSVEELASAMEFLALHPEERYRLGQAGRAFAVQYYNWQDNVSEMERVYRELLQTKGTSIDTDCKQMLKGSSLGN